MLNIEPVFNSLGEMTQNGVNIRNNYKLQLQLQTVADPDCLTVAAGRRSPIGS